MSVAKHTSSNTQILAATLLAQNFPSAFENWRHGEGIQEKLDPRIAALTMTEAAKHDVEAAYVLSRVAKIENPDVLAAALLARQTQIMLKKGAIRKELESMFVSELGLRATELLFDLVDVTLRASENGRYTRDLLHAEPDIKLIVLANEYVRVKFLSNVASKFWLRRDVVVDLKTSSSVVDALGEGMVNADLEQEYWRLHRLSFDKYKSVA